MVLFKAEHLSKKPLIFFFLFIIDLELGNREFLVYECYRYGK